MSRRRALPPLFATLLLLSTISSSSHAMAAGALPARTGEVLQKALVGSHWRATEGQIEAAQATVTICLNAEPRSCFRLRLQDPQSGCTGGKVEGPWCVRWPAEEPPAGLRQEVHAALRQTEDLWVRFDRGGVPNEETARQRGGTHWVPLRILAIAAAMVAVPLLGGWLMGRATRRWRWRWVLLLPAAAGVVALSTRLVELVAFISAWDIICSGILFALGMLIGGIHAAGRNLLLSAVALAASLIVLDLAVRLWLPPAPQFPPPTEARFMTPAGGWDVGCQVLYYPGGPLRAVPSLRRSDEPQQSIPSDDTQPWVVHLGDSMTFGYGVGERESFPAVLTTLQPGVAHANFGVWAVGTDFQYLLLKELLAARRPAMVVLHVYAGNDVQEVDREFECCDGGPLLAYASGSIQPRCPTPRWRFTYASRLGRSPPPFALRVATAWSHAARHLAWSFSRWAADLDEPPNFHRPKGGDASDENWQHFARILEAMQADLRASGVAFAVTVLPERSAFEAPDPQATVSYATQKRLVAIAGKLGIPTHDVWDLFAEAVRRNGVPHYFVGHNDIHLSPAGHRLLAEWLAASEGRWLSGTRSSAAVERERTGCTYCVRDRS